MVKTTRVTERRLESRRSTDRNKQIGFTPAGKRVYKAFYAKEKTPVDTSRNPTVSGGNESGYIPASNDGESANPTSLATNGDAGTQAPSSKYSVHRNR